MLATEASSLVKDMMREDGSCRSEASAHSQKSRTSQGASSRLSVKSKRLSLRIQKAVLIVQQSFQREQVKLLEEEIEVEQRRSALRRQLIALQEQQEREELKCKMLAMKKIDLAESQELAEINAVKQVMTEFEAVKSRRQNANILCTGPKAEGKMKEEERKGLSSSTSLQVNMLTPPSAQDLPTLVSGKGVDEFERNPSSSEHCSTSRLQRKQCDRQDMDSQLSDLVVTTKCSHQGSTENSRGIDLLPQSPIGNETPDVQSKIEQSDDVSELSDLKPVAAQRIPSCSTEEDEFMLREEKCSSPLRAAEPLEVKEDNFNVQKPIDRRSVIRIYKSSGDVYLTSCKTTAVQRNVKEALWAEVNVAENMMLPSRVEWESRRRKVRRKRKRWRLTCAEDQGIPDQGARNE